jgi:hypothetical protein
MRTDTSNFKTLSTMMWVMALLLVVFTAGCDSDHGTIVPPGGTVPTVIWTIPADGSTGVPINRKITAAFSEAMSAATVTSTSNFLITLPSGSLVTALSITYDATKHIALFTPSANLLSNTTYTGTITTGALSEAGVAMAADYVWSFKTGAAVDNVAPLLLNTGPTNSDMSVPTTQIITATFNEPMDPTTITPLTFTVSKVTGTIVSAITGSITYAGTTASFTPTSQLAYAATYSAVIAASDLAGNAWVSGTVPNPWHFTTVASPGPVITIDLGTAAPFGIAATAGITDTNTAPITHIEGDVVLVGTETCNGTAVPGGPGSTGFGAVGVACGATTPDSTPALVGTVVTSATTGVAVMNDFTAAFLSTCAPGVPSPACTLSGGIAIGAPSAGLGGAVGLPCTYNINGANCFTPGVYTAASTIGITGDLTLDGQGDTNAVFIFQAGTALNVADGAAPPMAPPSGIHTRILLINGTKASNVWWSVGSTATLGLYSEFFGNILAYNTIVMNTGATSCGRLLAGASGAGQFTFDSNVVSVPGNPFAPPATYATVCQ